MKYIRTFQQERFLKLSVFIYNTLKKVSTFSGNELLYFSYEIGRSLGVWLGLDLRL